MKQLSLKAALSLLSYWIIRFRTVTPDDPSGEHLIDIWFVLLCDFILCSSGILLAWLTSVLDEQSYFANEVVSCMRILYVLNFVCVSVCIPPRGISFGWFVVWVSFQACLITVVFRVFNVLETFLIDIGGSTIGVRVTVRVPIPSIKIVLIRKQINGKDLRLSPSTPSTIFSSNCAICHDQLDVCCTRAHSTRNLSFMRPRQFGTSRLFQLPCGHTFHKSCVMKWISENPIRLQLGRVPVRDPSSHQARCPLCMCPVELRQDRIRVSFIHLILGNIPSDG